MFDPTIPWVLLRIRNQLFGVPAANIREMAEMPAITRVPNMPEYVMGLISLRGQVTPTIDLRRRLGVPTAGEDLQQLTTALGQTESEHRRLAEALESLVQEGRSADPGTLTCSFHEWLATLETRNPLVRLHLKKLEEPHLRLHEAADRVVQAAGAGGAGGSAAWRRFQEKELAAFTRLLPQVRERLVLAHRQIVVVFTLDGRALGAAVDEVESIEKLKEGSIEPLSMQLQGMRSGLAKLVGRRTRDDEIVLLLEVEELFHGSGQAPIHGAWMEQTESPSTSSPEPTPASVPVATRSGSATTPALISGPMVPVAVLSGATEPCRGFNDGPGDHAWCGDPSGPWIQLAEGPIVQAGPASERDEAENPGGAGPSWM